MTHARKLPAGTVLNERIKHGVHWRARISADRGRLEVVGIVPPSSVATEVEPLTEPELLELLDSADADTQRDGTTGGAL